MVEPYEHGLLDVGDGQLLYWECIGNPHGIPVLGLHGGPGSGCSVGMRRVVDLGRHRLVLFDQRGCGRSRPHAADPAVDMSVNTTEHLLGDIERLREHLDVHRWIVFGRSWGSTLAIAYTARHQERVAGVVINGVTATSRAEIDWLYRGVGRFFPAEQAAFVAHVPEASAELLGPGGVLDAYAQRCASRDSEVREAAAVAWCAWEDALIAHEVQGSPGAYSSRASDARLAMVRIAAHYFSHAAWLGEGELIGAAAGFGDIPAALIHGRLDLSSPLVTAWTLARAWPGSQLTVVDDSGHTGSTTANDHMAVGFRTVADRTQL